MDAVLEALLDTYPADTPTEQPHIVDEYPSSPAPEPWGQAVVRLLEALGPIEMDFPEIDDPVEWVKAIRQRETDRLRPYWEDEA